MASYRPDHYTALGIRPDADADAIRAAYRNLAKQVHPDAGAAERAEATERFVRLQEAYDVLRDPLRRAQYDRERALEAERARAARQPIPRYPPKTPPKTPAKAPPPKPPPPAAPTHTASGRPIRVSIAARAGARVGPYWPYLAGMVVLLTVSVAIGLYQHYTRIARERQITVVRVEPSARLGYRERTALTDMPTGTPAHPGETGVLAKEVDRALQRQVDRVEEAKKKMEAQRSELAQQQQQAKAAAPGLVPKVPKVECSGAGRTFVMTHDDKDGTRVSTDGDKPVAPRISDLGTGVVLVSRIEPTNRLAIGFKKGLRDSTTVLMFDSAGSVQLSFNVECSAAAF
jgi:hypothetical protein